MLNLIQLISILAVPSAVLLYIRWANRRDAVTDFTAGITR